LLLVVYVRATCCQPPLVRAFVMVANHVRLQVGVPDVGPESAWRISAGQPLSQNWTPCGEELVGSFHSTSGLAIEGVFRLMVAENEPLLS